MLVEAAGGGVVALVLSQHRGPVEGDGPKPRKVSASACGQGGLQPAPALAEVAPHLPEAAEGGGQAQCRFGVPTGGAPGQGHP